MAFQLSSEALQFRESDGHQRLTLASGGMQYKEVYVGKIWPGMHSWDVSSLENQRRRWMTRHVDIQLVYTGMQSGFPSGYPPYTQSYVGDDFYQGAGNCPQTVSPASRTGSWPLGWTINPGGTIFQFVTFETPIVAPEGMIIVPAETSLTSRKWYNEQTFGLWNQTAIEVLGSESLYGTYLTQCHDALSAISIDSIPWLGDYNVVGKRFSDYPLTDAAVVGGHGPNQSTIGFNPGQFDGTVVEDVFQRHFGSAFAGDSNGLLDITYWFTLIGGDIGVPEPRPIVSLWGLHAFGSTPTSDRIYAKKMAAKGSTGSSYFIAEGDLTADGRLSKPKVMLAGSIPSTGLSVSLPALTPIADGAKGRIAFAIIGESQNAWQTRVGIAFEP